MIVYRISHSKYSNKIVSSGRPNRWNLASEYVIYTSGSISLCALELLAHTGGVRPSGSYQVMHIEITNDKLITRINEDRLPTDWHFLSAYPYTQNIGSEWYEQQEFIGLKIPSAIISSEHNYMLNTSYPDFNNLVRLVEVTDFIWDHRFPET